MTSLPQRLATGLLFVALLLAGCGGEGLPNTPLPAAVSVRPPGEAQPGQAIQFSTDLAGSLGGLAVRWTFGDGSEPTHEPTPVHTFAEPGDYEVSVTVSNQRGVSRQATLQVPVRRFALVRDRMCSLPSGGGWCWQQPMPSGNAVSRLRFVGGSDVWAMGQAGFLMHSADGGRSWSDRSIGTGATVMQIHMADAAHGWAQANAGLLLRTQDGGASWSPQVTGAPAPKPNAFQFPTFQALNAQTALATGTDRRGWFTTDGGQTWSATSHTVYAWAPDGALFSFDAPGDEGVLMRSTDLGASSTPVLRITNPWPAHIQLARLVFGDDGFVWAMSVAVVKPTPGEPPPPLPPPTKALTWWISVDAGLSWQARKMPPLEELNLETDLQTMTLYADGTGWVSESFGRVHYRTFDGGRTWGAPPMPPLVLKGRLRFWAYQLGRGVIAIEQGPRGPAYITRDNGTTWREFQFQPGLLLAPSGTLWAGDAGTVIQSSDDGVSWKRVLGPEPGLQGRPTALGGLCVVGTRQVLAAANGGWVWSSGDAGATWNASTLTPRYAQFGGWVQLQCPSPTLVWAGFAETTLRRSTDGGLSWAETNAPDSGVAIRAWHALDAQSVMVVLTDGRVFQSLNGGSTWSGLAPLNFPVRSLHFIDPQVGLAVGELGQIARTADAGQSWNGLSSGTTRRLNRLAQAPGNVLWVAGEGGELLRSSDLGLSWSRVATPATAELLDLGFASATHGWAVGAAGTVLSTTDGGRQWQVQRSGASADLVSVAAADPYTAWIGTGTGGVLVTASSGR